jgi:hypothetical protein
MSLGRACPSVNKKNPREQLASGDLIISSNTTS